MILDLFAVVLIVFIAQLLKKNNKKMLKMLKLKIIDLDFLFSK